MLFIITIDGVEKIEYVEANINCLASELKNRLNLSQELNGWIFLQNTWVKFTSDISFSHLVFCVLFDTQDDNCKIYFSEVNISPNVFKKNDHEIHIKYKEINKYHVFHWENILTYVKSELCKGVSFFDIEFTENGKDVVLFDKNVWMNKLLKNNEHSNDFLIFFTDVFYKSTQHKNELETLQFSGLFERLKIFLHDLKIFTEMQRFTAVPSNYPKYYLSFYYFTEKEIDKLLEFPTSYGTTLKDCLDSEIQYRNSIRSFCSSTDMFSIYVMVFDLKDGFDNGYSKISKKFKGV